MYVRLAFSHTLYVKTNKKTDSARTDEYVKNSRRSKHTITMIEQGAEHISQLISAQLRLNF